MSSVSQFPSPGTVLWGIDIDLERDVFRSGAASKPNVEYLRFIDLNLEGEGRIPDDELEKFVINPGKGISLFLERKIPEGLVLHDPSAIKPGAKEKPKKIHWWGIEREQPLPSGLQLVYDGNPPGHCTLTVTREMPISSFLSLVSQITFTLKQIDLVVPIH